MNDVSLNPEIVELEAEMEYEMPQYPVIPNPEGTPTDEITTMEIDNVIYEVKDAAARAVLPTKVDKVEGKGLSTNDYDDTAKGIVDGVTAALATKVDKDGDKVLSDNNYSDTDKTKLDGIEAEANKTVVDNSVTSTSTNPVESKAIYNLLNDLLPEATATGNPIAITNASGLNAKSLKVELEPIQDLHGYDSPWVGGSGKNLVDYPNVTIPSNGGFVFDTSFNGESGDYTVSFDFNADGSGQLLFRLYSGSTVVGEKTVNYSSGSSRVSATATATENFDSWRAYVNQSGSVSKIMVAKGSYSTYEPYSNICPISGRTQTTVSVNSEDTTVQFGQTVYGGEVKSQGGTSVNYTKINAQTIIANYSTFNASKHLYYVTLTGSLNAMTLNTATVKNPCNMACNILPFDFNWNEIQNFDGSTPCCGMYHNTAWDYTKLYLILPSTVTTRAEAETWLNNGGIEITYELATSTTLTTPAFNIPLNKGNNTLTADGDMELIYSKIPQ